MIHEDKQPLPSLLQVIVQYRRLRDDPSRDCAPRTVFFAGKAAPVCTLARPTVKLIHRDEEGHGI